jgi:hypothetical protein
VAELVGWRFVAAVEAANQRPLTILESLALLALATPSLNPDVAGLAQDIASPPPAEPEPATPKKRRGFFRRG